ncbi:hypothetical protein [Ketobacter sp.]|uniref:hypothetical protein n=1 Tax=Ketobacter sp. TaxID=2083498 RepID=UPI000F2BF58E|nr:hypothetical protein [Ketobacter sp.]RLT96899.1 MAG: hypothetical protein D9N14_12800 [Ketobacter sp.]
MPVTPLTSKLEFTLCKEAASIATTATELAAIQQTLISQIPQAEFQVALASVVAPLTDTYQALVYTLDPLFSIKSESDFHSAFPGAWDQYQQRFKEKNGIPRRCVESAYEAYLVFSQRKEAKTGFPILRRTFDRLVNYIDRYVDNDSWLLMNIDNVYKMLNLLLGEINELNQRDPEEAWFIYDQAMEAVLPFMQIINRRGQALAAGSTGAPPYTETPALAAG